MFSTEFGSKVNKDTYRLDPLSKNDEWEQLHEFVEKQFVFLQVYRLNKDRLIPHSEAFGCFSMKRMAQASQ